MGRFAKFVEKSKEEIDELAKTIQKDCSPFLREIAPVRKFLYRGTQKFRQEKEKLVKVTPRQDRRPKDTPLKWHNFADDQFKKRFKWKPRSEGIFVTGDELEAVVYGEIFIFLPIGSYKYLWSPQVRDFTDRIEEYNAGDVDMYGKKGAESFTEEIDEIFGSYTDKDLSRAISSGFEVMFKCKSYYLIKKGLEPSLEKRLWS